MQGGGRDVPGREQQQHELECVLVEEDDKPNLVCITVRDKEKEW